MIDLYFAPTTNGMRALFAMEESGLPYTPHRLNLQAGDQKKPEFIAINPAGRIPVLVDHDGPGGKPLMLEQSGAIALYLAERSAALMPADPVRRAKAIQWLMSACSDAAGAVSGTFMLAAHPAAAELYKTALQAQFALWDARLAAQDWIVGEFSVADLAFFCIYNSRKSLIDPDGRYANLARWSKALLARAGIARALKLAA